MHQKATFADKIIGFYRENARELPWRNIGDPYRIWLSEVIMQQTRVAQGLPYYLRFTEAFPTVRDLAGAEEETVLRLWQGLGYYSRARNMLKTARTVMEAHEGVFPDTYDKLIKLPGIGPYSAAAVASFSSGEAVAVLDGNVFRVLSRVFGMEDDISSGPGRKKFAALAEELLPAKDSADYNQGIMEFGATFCSPRKPNCPACIFRDDCLAFAEKKVQDLPFKKRKTKVVEVKMDFLVPVSEGKIGMKIRDSAGIWQNLYDFAAAENGEITGPVSEVLYAGLPTEEDSLWTGETEISAPNRQNFRLYSVSPPLKHLLSHRKLILRFFLFDLEPETAQAFGKEHNLQFYSPEEAENLPKPIVIADYLRSGYFTLRQKEINLHSRKRK